MPAATLAAAPPLDPPGTLVVVDRILHVAEGAVLVAAAHGELVAIGAAQDHGIGSEQTLNHRGAV